MFHRHLDENEATDIRQFSNLGLVHVTEHWEVTKLPPKARCDEWCTTKPLFQLVLNCLKTFLGIGIPATLKVWTTFCASPAVWASRTSMTSPALSPNSTIFLSRLIRQEQNSDGSPLNGATGALKRSTWRRCLVVGLSAGWAAGWNWYGRLPTVVNSTGRELPTVVDRTGRELPTVVARTGTELPTVVDRTGKELPTVSREGIKLNRDKHRVDLDWKEVTGNDWEKDAWSGCEVCGREAVRNYAYGVTTGIEGWKKEASALILGLPPENL